MENIWEADQNTLSDYFVGISKTPYCFIVGYAENGKILVTKDVTMDVFLCNPMNRIELKNQLGGLAMYKTAIEGIEKWANYLLKNENFKTPPTLSKSEIIFNDFINQRIKEGAKEIEISESRYYDDETLELTGRTSLWCNNNHFEFYGTQCIDLPTAIKLIPKALKIIDKRISK